MRASRCICCATPDGATWVLQEYTKDVDPSLTADNLDQLGGKYKELPEGWTFETKVLDRGPLARHVPRRRLGGIIRDEFHCTYQGCGYGADTNANYIP